MSVSTELMPYLSDTEVQTLTRYQRLRAIHTNYCDPEFVRDYLVPFARRHAGLLAADGYAYPSFNSAFKVLDRPTIGDLDAFRYVPVVEQTVCQVTIDG